MTPESSLAARAGVTSQDELLTEFGARCHFLMRDIERGTLLIERLRIERLEAWLVASVLTSNNQLRYLYVKRPPHLCHSEIDVELVEDYGLPLLRRHMILEDLSSYIEFSKISRSDVRSM